MYLGRVAGVLSGALHPTRQRQESSTVGVCNTDAKGDQRHDEKGRPMPENNNGDTSGMYPPLPEELAPLMAERAGAPEPARPPDLRGR